MKEPRVITARESQRRSKPVEAVAVLFTKVIQGRRVRGHGIVYCTSTCPVD
jgi:hypothetical protein